LVVRASMLIVTSVAQQAKVRGGADSDAQLRPGDGARLRTP